MCPEDPDRLIFLSQLLNVRRKARGVHPTAALSLSFSGGTRRAKVG